MPTPVLVTGFGLGTTAGWNTGPTGAKFIGGFGGDIMGTPAISSPGRDGSTGFYLQLAASGAAENVAWNTDTLGTSKTVLVGACYLRTPSSLPGSLTRLFKFESNVGDAQINYDPTSGQFQAVCAGGTARLGGPVIAAGEWHLIEWKFDVSGTTYTLDWRVDGVAMTQATGSSTANTIAFLTLGWNDSITATWDYTDLVVSVTGADYPLGGHKVITLLPDTGGTITGTNTSSFKRFTTNGTLDGSFNSANILAAIDDQPPTLGGSADGVAQNVSGTGSFIEIPMTTYTLQGSESVSGARMVSPCWASTTGTCTFGYRSFNGATETTLFAAADRAAGNSSTPSWVCKMLTLADINTQSELDALAMRVGFSGDISPVPGIHAIYIELAVQESSAIDKTMSDSAGATDVLQAPATVPLVESAAVAENLDTPLKTLSESASVSDKLAITATRPLLDSAEADESMTAGPANQKILSDSATATDVGTSFRPPLTITSGGTYTGNYASNDQNVPAVVIATTEQVNIDRMYILHAGQGIADSVEGINLKVTNTIFQRISYVTQAGGNIGRAINSDNPSSMVVEHCDLRQTNGIWIGGNSTCQPLRIRYNICRDVGYYPPNDCCIQFFQADTMTLPAGEIAWNHTINYHGRSQIEDNINLFKSGGASGSPLDIHHNLIDGSYASDVQGTGHTGGGILGGDKGGSFITIRNNWVVSTTNYGCAIVGGTDNQVLDNWVVNDARDQDGVLHGPNFGNGYSVWDADNVGTMTNIVVTGNTSGWLKQSPVGSTVRSDYFTPAATTLANNSSLSDPITAATEQAARDAWEAARQTAGIIVGITPLFSTIDFGTKSGSGSFTSSPATIDITTVPDFAWVYLGIAIGTTQGGANQVGLPGFTRLLDDDEDLGSHYAAFKRQKQPGDTTFSATFPVPSNGAYAWSSYTGLESSMQEEQVSFQATTTTDCITATTTPDQINEWAWAFFFNRTTTVGQMPSFQGIEVPGLTLRETPGLFSSSPFEGAALADSDGVVDTTPLSFTATSTFGTHGGAILLLLVPAQSNPTLSEFATASEALLITATRPMSETAAVSDKLVVTASNQPTLKDSATATESLGVTAPRSLPETVNVADALQVTATLTLPDSGAVIDFQPKTLLDSGTASDLMVISLMEQAIVIETLRISVSGLTGSNASGLQVFAQIPVPDLAPGTEALPFGIAGFLPVTLSDSATVTDVGRNIGLPVTLSETAQAFDGSGGGGMVHRPVIQKIPTVVIERRSSKVEVR